MWAIRCSQRTRAGALTGVRYVTVHLTGRTALPYAKCLTLIHWTISAGSSRSRAPARKWETASVAAARSRKLAASLTRPLRAGHGTGVMSGSCRGDRKDVDPVAGYLEWLALASCPGYHHDAVSLCRECGQLWLHHYWAVFDDQDPCQTSSIQT